MVSGAGCLKKVWCPLEPRHPVSHPSVIIGSSNVMDHFNTVKQRKYLQQTEKKNSQWKTDYPVFFSESSRSHSICFQFLSAHALCFAAQL